MDKKVYRRINLIKSLLLFVFIVCIVLTNLLWYSNAKNENKLSENNIVIES